MELTISVITAVYNGAATIGDMLQSLDAQTWPGVQHVVIDGGSTDGTADIVRGRPRPGRVVLSERDRGIYDALNKGLRVCSGDVVGILHADDVYAHAQVLELVAAAFADPQTDAVYGDLEYVSSTSGRVVRRWRAGPYSPRRLGRGWMPPHPTLFVRRSVYERLGGFDTRYRIAADYDLILRFLGQGRLQPAYIPEVLVRMRLGGVSNRSLGNILRKSAEDYRALRRNAVGGLGALCWKNLSKLGQFF